jgi:hypothetical protein
MPELHFDGSLEELARLERVIAICTALAIVLAIALYFWVERATRHLWAGVTVKRRSVGSPYRVEMLVVERLDRAPRLVRIAALACFAFGHVFVPGLVFVLATFRFDGLGVPLFPGVAIAFAIWCCGWLLLRRSDGATEITRLLGLVSLGLNGTLLVLSMAHFAVVEARWAGPLHECSASTVLAVCVFATASLPQAILMIAAVRKHAALFPVAATVPPRGTYDVAGNRPAGS